MHFHSLILTLVLLCSFAAAAVAAPAAAPAIASERILGAVKSLVVPRLERPPAEYKQKRDENKWVFGGFQTDAGECKEHGKCQLWEPIDPNGRPHPWCQTFSGSNGYTPLQQPSIESAHIDVVKDKKIGLSPVGLLLLQVSTFYLSTFEILANDQSNFDCDPSKDKDSAGRGSGFMTDKGPGSAIDLSFTKMINGQRIHWFKAYGCMLYDDAPFKDETTTGNTGDMMAAAGVEDLGSVVEGSDIMLGTEAKNSTLGGH